MTIKQLKKFGAKHKTLNTERGSIERLDMFCELRTWQYEELGSSALAELELNKCPKDGLKRPPKEQTLRRLSQTLTKDEL